MKKEDRYFFKQNDSSMSLNQVGNYCNIKKPFKLTSTTLVKLSACGEVLIGEKNGKRDVFEMYLDPLNGKEAKFDSKIHRFLFFSEIGGSSFGTQAVFQNTGPNEYSIEIACPWKYFDLVPSTNAFIGFDFAYSDNDNGFEQTKQIAWHSDDSDIWLDPRLWGNLQLLKSDSKPILNDSTIFSLRLKEPLMLDGRMEACWINTPLYHAENVLYSDVAHGVNNKDIRVSLRSLWDDEKIYFFVSVVDDVIIRQSYMGKVFDYGWIESGDGQIIWKLDRSNARHSGGALKNNCSDTIIVLKPGDYFLCYQSDESHSYQLWDDEPPDRKLYGIELLFKRR